MLFMALLVFMEDRLILIGFIQNLYSHQISLILFIAP